ncbi:hypothetical protein [Hymenobacter edaphi]|uniref:Uncharacterized protein n=1 Tax=Hymenobacter edaphi TaxID=2211146 RepID=A0A328BT61_9BACT|nr:hypothetical protein [Hymenobacter edaphi]RAK70317.1 hypothetical protein DLM85_05590 [Hymenobacter edaphi]
MFAAFTIPLALVLLTLLCVSVSNLLYHGLLGFDRYEVEAGTVWWRHAKRTFLDLAGLGVVCGSFELSAAASQAVILAGAVLIPVGLLVRGHRRHFR